MIYLGAGDVVVAQGEVRRVCDLYSSHFLAWVDNRRQNLEVAVVQNAANVAAVDGRYPLVFVPGGIYPEAQDIADTLGVALLRFDSLGGDLDGASAVGGQLRARGLATIAT
jgi:putative intracellular protease/amidase